MKDLIVRIINTTSIIAITMEIVIRVMVKFDVALTLPLDIRKKPRNNNASNKNATVPQIFNP